MDNVTMGNMRKRTEEEIQFFKGTTVEIVANDIGTGESRFKVEMKIHEFLLENGYEDEVVLDVLPMLTKGVDVVHTSSGNEYWTFTKKIEGRKG